MKNKGFAIILVLATLVLLALLAITYITLSLTDRNITRNYMDTKRAKLIAQSGVEYSLARLHEITQSSAFFTSNWQNFTKGMIKINGADKEYTESAGSTYGENRDVFKVTARDCNSMINVNDGLGNERVTGNLKRMLNNLGKIVGINEIKIGGKLGDVLIDPDKRPYPSKQALLRAVNNDTYEFNKFKDFVTTHAWQDPNVANPVPLSSAVLEKYQEFNDGYASYDSTIGIYRYGRGKDKYEQLLPGEFMFGPDYILIGVINILNLTGKYYDVRTDYDKYAIYALDELNPQWIELTSRSPVNINLSSETILKVLLKDLKGIFVTERRSAFPEYFNAYDLIGGYANHVYEDNGHDYSFININTNKNHIDELGFLYCTQPIDYDPVLDQGLAKDIAKHIDACREKKVVAKGVLIDYTDTGSLWFRGPFKSWRQFNAFVDNLVQSKVIQDTRKLSEYYLEKYAPPYSNTETCLHDLVWAPLTSPVIKIAHQAKGDLLKANFNPNLHLNELNPDANIATLVDKTDLIVNSTEFCCTPMGYFEIESEGVILKESGLDNIKIAGQKVDAVVKLYDCSRETNQKQFLGHINNLTDYNNLIGTSSPVATNNTRTIQVGPDPDHIFDGSAPIAKGNEWGGYISLPTLKGQASGSAVTLYSNFTSNFNADYHADGVNSNIVAYNSADPTELKAGGAAEPAGKGPYIYSDRNRLARSFRKTDTINPRSYAVSDLRIDGAYIERHASIVYDIPSTASKGTLVSNVMKSPGFWSYWVKPWFHPESTGKARSFVSFSYYLRSKNVYYDTIYFANWFFASQGVAEGNEVITPSYSTQPGSTYYFKSSSLIFGYSSIYKVRDGITGSGRGLGTPCLNHIYHSDKKLTYMKSGHWTHVICSWDLENTDPSKQIKLLVNGGELSNFTLPNHEGTITMGEFLKYSKRLRLGEPIIDTADDPVRNWTCDATLDEFYIFSGTSDDLTKATGMYLDGRYLRPSTDQSYFISQPLRLSKDNVPRDSKLLDPEGFLPPSQEVLDQKTKIIGLSWTWYAEDTDTINISDPDKFGKAILKDYKDYQAPVFRYPVVKIKLRKNGADELQEYKDDGYSLVNLELEDLDTIQYKVIIEPNVTLDTVLLYSPVFDDITIYYSSGVQFLAYSSED